MTQIAPPRLVYDYQRPPRAAGLCLLAVAGLGAVALLLWMRSGAGESPWPATAAWLLCSVLLACALHCWRRWPCGRLEWDGRQWWLSGRNALRAVPLIGAPRLQWDGQSFILLHVTLPAVGQRWLWLQSSSAPVLWGELRRAVYWPARPVSSA